MCGFLVEVLVPVLQVAVELVRSEVILTKDLFALILLVAPESLVAQENFVEVLEVLL